MAEIRQFWRVASETLMIDPKPVHCRRSILGRGVVTSASNLTFESL
jgi:hypothetical protein